MEMDGAARDVNFHWKYLLYYTCYNSKKILLLF